ncbi:MAG: histidine kinase [Chitinophagaceae bacterium]|nr:histidine kinase [Chitinophagaceae bacterium]
MRSFKAKAVIRQQMAELKPKPSGQQMNPHFIFNSLNAIQEPIIDRKTIRLLTSTRQNFPNCCGWY